MLEINWGKVITNLGALAAGIVLIIKNQTTEGVAIITLITGYTYGNGRAISKGEAPSNMVQLPPPPGAKHGHVVGRKPTETEI